MGKSAKAEVEVTASSKTLGAKLREARAKFATFGLELKKQVFGKDMVEKGFWGKGGAQMVGNLGSSAVSTGASFLADQAKSVFNYNEALTRLQITAEKSPEAMQALSTTVKEASNATGIGKDKILAASSAYVALTGDLDTAQKSTKLWAEVAQATNSNIDDISKTAAALSQNSKVGPEDMEAAFAALAIQGKAGAIELKDLAAQMSTIAPQWAMFKNGTGVEGVKQLGAALQIVKRGFGGDASETVTGLQSLLTALVKNAGRLQKGGVKVFDKDPTTGVKTMRSVFDIVKDIGDSKLMKDPTKLEKAFGRVEAYRAFLQLKDNKGALDEMVKSSSDVGVIQRDLTTYMQSDAGRVTQAWEKMKNAIAEAFTPERITGFVNAIESLAEKIGPVVDGVGKIGGVLGKFYGVGQKMSEWQGNNGHRKERIQDSIILGEYGEGERGAQYLSATYGKTPAQIENMKNAAYRNKLEVQSFNKSVDSIMGGEKDDKSTEESVQRAIMSFYSGKGDSAVYGGEHEAGSIYLRNANVNPQQYVADKLGGMGSAGGKEVLVELKNLSDAIAQLAKAGINITGDSIESASKKAPTHRARPRG